MTIYPLSTIASTSAREQIWSDHPTDTGIGIDIDIDIDIDMCSSGRNQEDDGLTVVSSNSVIKECPLHIAIRELAQTAVKQHVLHLEGECCPRTEPLQGVEKWSSLSTLIYSRVCPASRTSSISPAELQASFAAIIPPPSDARTHPLEHDLCAMCFACAQATSCPLGKES